MMATVAVTSLLPTYNAKADESRNDGAICTPTTEPLGDQTSGSGNDEGIATFVGGDMYVGGKKSGITSANNNNAPEGSYAVEAEGLTAVNGKLLLHPMKQAWNIWNKDGSFNRSRGFHWGIVGFGSQFRPKDGSTVLSVGGNSTNSELNWFGGAQGWTDDANQGSSWLGTGAGNGATGETNDHNFNANIAGNQTTVQSRNTWKNGEQYSVYDMGGNGKVNWNQSNTVISGVKNPSTGSDYTYSEYKNYVTTLSGKLAKISSSNTVTKGNEDNYTGKRYSYSYNTYANNVYRFDIENNSRQTEITLTGDGKDELQVFNLDASKLNSIGDAGVVFNFKNISDNASVAININGNGNDVKFRNGWQFKWNDVDISDGYVMMNSTGTNRYNNTHGQEYVKRASQLMWNFYNTNTLTILGGKGSGRINTGWYKDQKHGDKEDWYGVNVTDDPSAAWMGSVMVTGNDFGAKGNFQSHVSTNGRVWTTGDFEMYNKDVVTTNSGNFVNAEGKYSTSAVDMDQERHNLSWYGQMTTSCAAIKWDKVDAEGKALKGTSWTVYGTRDNAVNGTNSITTVADGGWNDADDADNGSVTLGSLAKKATYYLKESGTGSSQYALNTNIYRIVTHDSTDTVSTIDKVYSATGAEITDDTAKQLHNGAIVNVSAGTSIAWSKVDAEDQNTLLAGSTWELTKKGDPDQSWTITDDDSDSEIANIVVKINETEVSSWSFTNSTPVSISYVAVDKDGKELATKVQWKSESPAVAGIASDGTQLQPYSNGTTNIVFTAGDKTVTFPVMVTGVTVVGSVSIDKYTEGQEISLEQGKTMTLTATVAPEGNTVNWSSSNTDEVSVSPSTGTAVTVTAKNTTSSYVTITATEQRGKKKAGRGALAAADAVVGVGQRRHDELLAHRLFENDVEQRQQAVVQPLIAQLGDAFDRMPGGQQLEHFVEQAGRRHVFEQFGHFADRLACFRVDDQAELGGETNGAQHADRVLAIAGARFADHAQRFLLEVADAVVVVEHRLGGRVVIQRVGGEVAARGILGLRAKNVVVQHAAVLVLLGVFGEGATEGRHLQCFLAHHDVHDLEAAADDARAAEVTAYFLRRGVGGDVEILGLGADQQVAHGAADDIGLVAVALQRFADAPATAADAVAGDAVVGDRDDGRFVSIGLGFLAAENAGDEFADHVLPFSQCWLGCVKCEFYRMSVHIYGFRMSRHQSRPKNSRILRPIAALPGMRWASSFWPAE